MKYLVTAKIEVFQLVEADSEEDVHSHVEWGGGVWNPVRNQEPQDIKIKVFEIEASGEEIKETK